MEEANKSFSDIDSVIDYLAKEFKSSLQKIIEENSKRRLNLKGIDTTLVAKDYTIHVGLHEFGIVCNPQAEEKELFKRNCQDKVETYAGCASCDSKGYQFIVRYLVASGSHVTGCNSCEYCKGEGKLKVIKETSYGLKYKIEYGKSNDYLENHQDPKKRLFKSNSPDLPRTAYVNSGSYFISYLEDICNVLNTSFVSYDTQCDHYDVEAGGIGIMVDWKHLSLDEVASMEEINFGNVSCEVSCWNSTPLVGINGAVTSERFYGYKIKWSRKV